MRVFSLVAILGSLTIYLLLPTNLSGQSSSLHAYASWETRAGEQGRGEIVLPDQLWDEYDALLVRKNRAYQRIPIGDLRSLVVGSDTVFRYRATAKALAGGWQLLTGGTHDLYVQRRSRRANTRMPSRVAVLDWVLLLFAKRHHDRYALRRDSQWVAVDFRYPLRELLPGPCPVPRQHPFWPSQRRLWRIGQAINACSPEGITYSHPLLGHRWEWAVATNILTPTRRNLGESFQSLGGRLSVVKTLRFITKHLSLQADLAWFNYRQEVALAVQDFSGVGQGAAYIFQSPSQPADRDYAMSARMRHSLLGASLRWEVAPEANISMTLQWGIAWQFSGRYVLAGNVLEGNDVPGLPSSLSIKETVRGGWTPYGGLGLRSRLRHDWRLGLNLRSYPVLDNYNWRFPPENFASWLQSHSLEAMDFDFSLGVELVLSKIVF